MASSSSEKVWIREVKCWNCGWVGIIKQSDLCYTAVGVTVVGKRTWLSVNCGGIDEYESPPSPCKAAINVSPPPPDSIQIHMRAKMKASGYDVSGIKIPWKE